MAIDLNITGQYLVNGVPVGGSANPSVIAANYADGTVVTGTVNDTISRSLLIPANTFTGNGMLEVLVRASKTGTGGSATLRVYRNTTASLTGAVLIGVFASTGAGFYQGIRTFRINSNNITYLNVGATLATDYTTNVNVPSSTAFNTAVDQHIIFSVQLANAGDSMVVNMARAVEYF
jgi:hypothetical protein